MAETKINGAYSVSPKQINPDENVPETVGNQ
jgi:hypothetical protein